MPSNAENFTDALVNSGGLEAFASNFLIGQELNCQVAFRQCFFSTFCK